MIADLRARMGQFASWRSVVIMFGLLFLNLTFMSPAQGLIPVFVEKVRQRRRAGLVPRGEYQQPGAVGPRRGPRSDGPCADRWVNGPRRRS